MVFVSALEPCGCAGYIWEKGGPEGAILVDEVIAWKIIKDLPGKFFVANEPVKATPKEIITEVVEKTAEVVETPAVTTKRRSIKE
jgi:hypothetical protein